MQLSALFFLVLTKCVITAFGLALPFLVASSDRLAAMTDVTARRPTFFRLYGVAMVALLIAYAGAFPLMSRGVFPWAVVLMGVVSNGGGAFVLMCSGGGKPQRSTALLFGVIGFAFALCGVFPRVAMQPLI